MVATVQVEEEEALPTAALPVVVAPAPLQDPAPPPAPMPSMRSAFGAGFGRILGGEAAVGRQPWFVDLLKDEDAQAAWRELLPTTRGAYRRLGLSYGGNVVQEAWTKEEAITIVSRKTGVPRELLEAIGSS